MDLVIVESPSKSKTISKYLGSGYKVLASGGHVRDLPADKLGVNVHRNFEPEYEVYPQKENTIKQLKKEIKNCEKIYLATDPDREGEAISWHLKNILGIDGDNVRIVFNEITKKAVNKAIENPRDIDMNLVNSQQARRVLDRLVGYLISPVLSKKIQKGLSAGRVQSVALRMICEKEREILAFKPEEYWNIFANISADGQVFHKAQFNDINGKKRKINNQEDALKVERESKLGNWYVSNVKRAKSISKPNPPFTTSTMQQDAVNKLNFSATQVMKIAQQLYEGVNIKDEGLHALVTYIRTDSVRISDDAMFMAKNFINTHFGSDYYPKKANVYSTKGNAQDAHEAIRPVNLDYTPEYLKGKIENEQWKLYKLIYDRFLASQMVPAEYNTLTVNIASDYNGTKYGYLLKGKTLVFAGFTKVYTASKDEEDEDIANTLPNFNENDKLILKELTKEQKFTKPPLRYTDSTIVKAMEENGIGRPSTYASIISVIYKRQYIEKEGKYMKPTELGFIVCDQLVKYFPNIMDTQFTAEMESKLDIVADGEVDWHKIISDFYPGFLKNLEKANDGQRVKIEPIMTDIKCPDCGKPMVIRDGKYGKFLGCSDYPNCKKIMPYSDNPQADGNEKQEEILCPDCGKPMVLKNSKYGKFYGCSGYPECNKILRLNEVKKMKNPDGESAQTENIEENTIFYNSNGYDSDIANAEREIDAAAKNNEQSQNQSEDVICENCGAKMVIKNGRYGEFYACPNYPNCKNIVPIKKKKN